MSDAELRCPRCGDGILYLQPDETLSRIMHGEVPRITDREYTINVRCGECNETGYVIRGQVQRTEEACDE